MRLGDRGPDHAEVGPVVTYLPVPALGPWIVYSFLLPAGPLCVVLGISIGSWATVLAGLTVCGAALWWWRVMIQGAERRYTDGRPTVRIDDVRFRAGYSVVADEGGVGTFGNDAWEVRYADGVRVRYLTTPGLREVLAVRCPRATDLQI